MVLKVNVVGALHLEAVHCILCLGNVDLIIVSVRHYFFSLTIYIKRRFDFSFRRRISSVRSYAFFIICKFC